MAGSRSTPPLYELLSDAERSSPASRNISETQSTISAKPTVVVKPTPLTPPSALAPDPGPQAEPDQTEIHNRSITFTFTPSGIMLGVAAMFVLVLFVWIAGSKFGASKKDQEWSDAVGGNGSQAPLKDPLREDLAGGTLAIPEGSSPNGVNLTQPEQQRNKPPSQQPTSRDPRQAGLNYLHLVTLGKDDAAAAVTFLAENGVQATAAIDPSSSRSNNRARYKVFALVGITGAQYKNDDPVKRLHEQKIREIGARWLSQGGASNFSQPLWTKFQG